MAQGATSHNLWSLIKDTLSAWSNDRGSRLAAALSYYTIFSIAPLLLIVLTLVGVFFGNKQSHAQLHSELGRVLPALAVKSVEGMVVNARKAMGTGIWQIVVGVALLLYASTNFFVTLQDGLNTVWHVQPKPGRGIKGILEDRALTFVMVACVGLFLLAATAVTPMISEAGHRITGASPVLLQLGNAIASIVLFTIIFAFLFKALPDAEIDLKDTFIGALVTATAFTIAKWILGFVLLSTGTKSIYGTTGALVVLLLFIYYSAMIVLFGAEFTKVYALRDGKPIVPSKNAEHIKVNAPAPGPESHASAVGTSRPGSNDRGSGKHLGTDAARLDAESGETMKYPADRYNLPWSKKTRGA